MHKRKHTAFLGEVDGAMVFALASGEELIELGEELVFARQFLGGPSLAIMRCAELDLVHLLDRVISVAFF